MAGSGRQVIYPPSLVEPTWHPVQRTLHDSQGRLLEPELQSTSDLPLIGKYAYDSENRRIVLVDPCPGAEVVNPFEAMLTALWQLILLLLGITRASTRHRNGDNHHHRRSRTSESHSSWDRRAARRARPA